jgi:hypothetical protein
MHFSTIIILLVPLALAAPTQPSEHLAKRADSDCQFYHLGLRHGNKEGDKYQHPLRKDFLGLGMFSHVSASRSHSSSRIIR